MIAHYRITAKLGEGGMGEVYRAVDTKLDREVALKILPAAFASDSGRMARFELEAKVLASLNHPNIAAIYGVEERALVMELVEGASPKGPMPFDDAWKIASQIAAALEYAHDKGIVHRDLKPDNIKITPDGVVKLLDFGLAKAFTEQKEPSANPEHSPTLTIGATEVGVILGTAAYMAPEQAKGKSVDKRADIWAFGVVLYELLTGEHLFKGDDVADTLAQVLTKEPQLDRVPVKVRRLLMRCLDKDPKRRLRDIGEAQFLLNADAEIIPPGQTRSTAKLPWIVATVLALGLGALAFIRFREKPAAAPAQRYTMVAPVGSTLHSFAISPDGRNVAIAAEVKGKRQLWLRALDALQAQPMSFTEDATFPFWSPDSRYIGFFAQGKLMKVAASGGPSQSLCDAPVGRGGSWNRDDVIVFSPAGSGASIQRVSAAGGVPKDLFKTKAAQLHPVFLPDGRHFLYLARGSTPEENGIYISSLDGTENRRILADISSAVFAPPSNGGKPGHILFVREDTLMAQPFDPVTAQLAGDAFPVADGVGLTNVTLAPATVSGSGVLLYTSGTAAGVLNQIALYDRTGKFLDLVVPPGAVDVPAISPNEKSIVFARANGSAYDLWLRDLARGTESRFTTDASVNSTPFWSPKGDRIVFESNRHAPVLNLFQKATSGSGQEEILLISGRSKEPTHWSRDGRFIVYKEFDPKTKFDIWVLPVEGSGKERTPFPFLQTEFNEMMGQLSPDSHWMAYTSDQSGRREVYVRPFPRAEGQTMVSVAGGEQPRWRGDGRELFYVAADGKMVAVPVNASAGPKPSFDAGAPVALFDSHMAPTVTNNIVNYDVTADGKRFLIDTPAGPGSASQQMLNVVVNWNAGLRK
ncbi:MAG TPA: protein kinase [Bryobacteraceae bacterium]|nr:protein kinase [Bryobacteraceae bacterium]